MKFQPGNKMSPGRPPGAISKRTKQLQETLIKHGFDVGETWLELLADARENFETAHPDNKAQYLKIAADITSNIADRVYPRLKSIEHKSEKPTDSFTPEQRLEMLKAAAKALENELSRHGPSLRNGSGDHTEDKSGGLV